MFRLYLSDLLFQYKPITLLSFSCLGLLVFPIFNLSVSKNVFYAPSCLNVLPNITCVPCRGGWKAKHKQSNLGKRSKTYSEVFCTNFLPRTNDCASLTSDLSLLKLLHYVGCKATVLNIIRQSLHVFHSSISPRQIFSAETCAELLSKMNVRQRVSQKWKKKTLFSHSLTSVSALKIPYQSGPNYFQVKTHWWKHKTFSISANRSLQSNRLDL